MSEIGFDGVELGTDGSVGCSDCNVPLSDHDKERDYSGKGPAGSYSYNYICP